MAEEPDSFINTSQLTSDDITPKKKKKKHRDKVLQDDLSLESENKSSGLGSLNDEDQFVTPKKKMKKKKQTDGEDDAQENVKEIKENGIGDTFEENPDTEGFNISMLDDETLGASHKKKKKKKKDSHRESTDEAQTNSVHEENVGASAVEEEVSDVPHKTNKKKKRTNSEENNQAQVDGLTIENVDAEGMNSSMIGEDSDGVLHTKKKKKKKADLDASTGQAYEENGHTEGNSTCVTEGENCVLPHKKKKKKKADLDKSSEQACEENGHVDANISTIDDEDLGVPHKKKKKKKKKKKEDLNETLEETQTNLECVETEPCNSSMVELENCEVTRKKKKRKRASLDESMEQEQSNIAQNNDTDELPAGVTEQETAQTSSKKKKKRKREDCEESRNDTVTENISDKGLNDKNKSVLEDGTLFSMIKDIRQEVDDATRDADVPKKKGKNETIQNTDDTIMVQEMEAEISGALENDNINDSVEQETADNIEESGKPEEIEDEEFTMIDEVKEKRKARVDRVLPEWLSNPTAVSTHLTEGLPIKDLVGLDPFLVKRLNGERIEKFFPIQAAVIPELLATSKSISMRYRPRDICVSAPTGSGKTLSYVLPLIQALRSRVVPRLRALVLLPTQELAKQVHSVFEKYTRFSKLKICLAVGSHSFKKEQESLVFEDSIGDCAADILVATPGRLSDHIAYTERLSFKYLRFLVVDEADLFLSSSGGSMMLKIEQLKKQIRRPIPNNSIICGGFQPKDGVCLPEPYLQQMLFSATLMHDPEQLKVLDLHRPKLFIASEEAGAIGTLKAVVPYIRPEELKEEYMIIDSTVKPLVLYHMINTKKLRRVLVFTKSTIATKTLSIVLSAMSKRYKVAKFSSKESQRKEILADFSSGKIDVLISSDAMARGLDITRIDQVVSYDVPSVQTYVHRIGRTGRAGRRGFALSLVENTPDARRDFKAILTSCKDRLTKVQVTDDELAPYSGHYQKALATLKETMLKEKKTQKLKKLKGKIERIKKSKEKKKAMKKT